MKASQWNNDHPANAPAHCVDVWIAYEPVDGKGPVEVTVGFFDSVYRKWRFEEPEIHRRTAVADLGYCVIGWLPIEKPTYEAA